MVGTNKNVARAALLHEVRRVELDAVQGGGAAPHRRLQARPRHGIDRERMTKRLPPGKALPRRCPSRGRVILAPDP
jgi:hypothetical protein